MIGNYISVEHEQTATYIIQTNLKSMMSHQKIKVQRLTHATVPFKQNFKTSMKNIVVGYVCVLGVGYGRLSFL